ncbi:MAG TPA: LytTR family DNA-binding domain-containing protein [Bacteroidia bacterium]|jgi:two-component system LytT family response regulator|nr:LytTR family DNA-binding domain-containing protein [Bacteroidia bacterium]
MNPLKIIIVDDEKRIRNSLVNVLKLHYPNVNVVAEAEDVTLAITAVKKHNPDVVLLDIKMPDGTGFDMIKQLMPLTFKIIFITAFDQYAIQAFKFSAIDYLLKPVIPEDLVNALQRVVQQLDIENSNTKLDVFMSNMSDLTRDKKKIVLNSHDKMHIISLNEVIRCEADRNYTQFFLFNKKSVLVSRPLKDYDDMLSEYGFFRCHHSHLINLEFVDRLEKKEGGILIMKDGSEVLVASRKYTELIAALHKF